MARMTTRELRDGDSGSGTDFFGWLGNVLRSPSLRARQVLVMGPSPSLYGERKCLL